MSSSTMPLPRLSDPQPAAPAPRPTRRRRSLRGLGIAVLAAAVTAGIVLAGSIPSLDGVGAAWTSFLPWTVVLLVLLAVAAVVRRAWWGLSAVIVAVMVWSAVFVPQMMAAQVPAGASDLVVATQNIGAGSTDQAAAARALVGTGAGLVAVQEIVGTGDATAVLDAGYGYHARVSTVGLWSQWAMEDAEPLELGLSWARAFRVVVHHPAGDIAVYAVHLPSVRPGDTAARDQAVAELAGVVAADPSGRVLVMGDLNTAGTDPVFDRLTGELADSRETVRGGFGFTWPAQFPLTRPDHVLSRGIDTLSDQVLAGGGSDHRAVVVGLRVGS
ncbi:endonuclease/exonuclease/phosphatase family protein [Nakamurella sp. GG22]